MRYKKIKEMCQVEKINIVPVKGEKYNLFSFSAFDNGKNPETVDGGKILSGKFSVSENTILFNKLNVKFKRVWNIKSLPVGNNICSTEFFPLKAKEGYSQDYLYYNLISKPLTDAMNKSRKGTSNSQQRIDINTLFEYEIFCPSYDEQCQIASILSLIDDKINLNNAINQNLEQQAQAIYQLMFITKADPTWKRGNLSDFVAVKYGKDHKKLSDGSYPVYGSGGIMRYVEKPLYDKESVLIPRKGSLNNVMYISEPFWSVDTMFYTEMRIPNVAKYVFHFIKTKDLAALNAGSAVPSMTTDILNAMEVTIPSAEALKDFEELVAPMYNLMETNKLQSSKLAMLRDTLLPRLMSGELDLSDIDF